MVLGETKWRTSADGTLELVDLETGHILAVEKKKSVDRQGAKYVRGGPGRGRRSKDGTDTHHWVMVGRKKMWLPKGTNPDSLPKTIWPYSRTMCETICQMVTEGQSLKDICAIEGFPPYPIVMAWKRKYPEFKAQLTEAKKDRAEAFAELALEVAEESDPENVQNDKLLVETYRWHAEIGDREQYGKQQKITGDASQPLGFIIDTGIYREPARGVDALPVGNSPASGGAGETGVQAEELRQAGGGTLSESSSSEEVQGQDGESN